MKASRKESHSVIIRFMWTKDPNAIHSEICPVYGDKCFKQEAIYVWCKKFARGRESVLDEKCPARCVVSMTDAAIIAAELLISA